MTCVMMYASVYFKVEVQNDCDLIVTKYEMYERVFLNPKRKKSLTCSLKTDSFVVTFGPSIVRILCSETTCTAT